EQWTLDLRSGLWLTCSLLRTMLGWEVHLRVRAISIWSEAMTASNSRRRANSFRRKAFAMDHPGFFKIVVGSALAVAFTFAIGAIIICAEGGGWSVMFLVFAALASL